MPKLTPARRRLLDRLLEEALSRPGNARQAYLDACRRRAPRLSGWLQRLVDASTQPTHFLETGPAGLAASALRHHEQPYTRNLPTGTRLGPWRLIKPVGRGGMGSVYQAERGDGAFEMSVAIKLIQSSRKAFSEVLEAERRVLARLDHPGIARLLDGGVADDDRPYLVMEWVPGLDLDAWRNARARAPAEYLEVFRQVGEAVASAHQRLVVHGDIKPANIRINESGAVKLLDFGVARLLTSGRAKGKATSALTPDFAAPEQVAGEPVSTQTDIYSLGVLLQWLLTGVLPGGGEQPAWSDLPRGRDLRAVVARATRQRSDQRYPTVAALLDDVRALSAHRAVSVRRPGPMQWLGMSLRRHTVASVLAVIAVCALATGLGVALWQTSIAAQERDIARNELALADAVRSHLVVLFREVGSQADDPERISARELLDQTLAASDEWLAHDPLTRLQVQAIVGEVLIALHDYRTATPILERFVEADDGSAPATLRALIYQDLAQMMHRQGDLPRAVELASTAVDILEDRPGGYVERLSDALQVRGRVTRDAGQWEAALADLQRGLALARSVPGPSRPVLARAENNLAVTLLGMGDIPQARRHMEAALEHWRAMGRGESSDAVAVMTNLAALQVRQGAIDEAERVLRETVRIRHARFGASAALAAAHNHLGRLLIERRQLIEAQWHLETALRMARRFAGEGSPDAGAIWLGLGELAQARGKMEQAGQHYTQARRVLQAAVGDGHPFVLFPQVSELIDAAAAQWVPDAVTYDRVLEQVERHGARMAPQHAALLCGKARWLLLHADAAGAASAARQCLETRNRLEIGGWRELEARALLAQAENRVAGRHVMPPEAAELARLLSPGYPRFDVLGARPPGVRHQDHHD